MAFDMPETPPFPSNEGLSPILSSLGHLGEEQIRQVLSEILEENRRLRERLARREDEDAELVKRVKGEDEVEARSGAAEEHASLLQRENEQVFSLLNAQNKLLYVQMREVEDQPGEHGHESREFGANRLVLDEQGRDLRCDFKFKLSCGKGSVVKDPAATSEVARLAGAVSASVGRVSSRAEASVPRAPPVPPMHVTVLIMPGAMLRTVKKVVLEVHLDETATDVKLRLAQACVRWEPEGERTDQTVETARLFFRGRMLPSDVPLYSLDVCDGSSLRMMPALSWCRYNLRCNNSDQVASAPRGFLMTPCCATWAASASRSSSALDDMAPTLLPNMATA